MKGEDTLMRTSSRRGARRSGARRPSALCSGALRSSALPALSLSLALGGVAVTPRGRLRWIGANLAGLPGARHLDLGAFREPPEPGGDDAFRRRQAARDHSLEIV